MRYKTYVGRMEGETQYKSGSIWRYIQVKEITLKF